MSKAKNFPAYRRQRRADGSERAFVLTGIYGDVCPVEIWPDHLAKALIGGDLEDAEKHGLLDCVHCGLCTFIDPSKIEIGGILRKGLDEAWRGV